MQDTEAPMLDFESAAETPRAPAAGAQAGRPRWASLSAVVLDAVWTPGTSHGRVVVPLVHRVLGPAASGPMTTTELPATDSHPLPRLLARFPDAPALEEAAQNRQRTSTRGGVPKAEAVLRVARILVAHGLLGVDDLPRVLADPAAMSRIDRALRGVPGEGEHGSRRHRLWQLCAAGQGLTPAG
ncbi:hypothetical protein JD78_02138 [Modestobacter roseus]|uniref:Uncharacterized protein n=1 Tax=Modestobacter roseus TaxID=1181884 RepID=A0A562ISS9_9ACTN|nr:hypothetical protein JD78_02138 [Modestobacter roseus]